MPAFTRPSVGTLGRHTPQSTDFEDQWSPLWDRQGIRYGWCGNLITCGLCALPTPNDSKLKLDRFIHLITFNLIYFPLKATTKTENSCCYISIPRRSWEKRSKGSEDKRGKDDIEKAIKKESTVFAFPQGYGRRGKLLFLLLPPLPHPHPLRPHFLANPFRLLPPLFVELDAVTAPDLDRIDPRKCDSRKQGELYKFSSEGEVLASSIRLFSLPLRHWSGFSRKKWKFYFGFVDCGFAGRKIVQSGWQTEKWVLVVI